MRGWLCALLLTGCISHLRHEGNAAGFGAPIFRSSRQGVATLTGGVVSPDGDLAFLLIDQLEARPGFAPLWTGGAVVSLALDPLVARWRLPLPAEVRVWDWAPAAHALWASRAQGDQVTGLFALRPGGMIEPPEPLGADSCGPVVPVLGGRALVTLATGGGTLRYWRRDYAAYDSASIVPGPAMPSCSAIELEVERDRVAVLVPLGTLADPRYGVASARLSPTGRLDDQASGIVSPTLQSPEVRLTADAVASSGRWLAMRAEGTGQPHEVVFDTATGERLVDERLPDEASAVRFLGDSLVIGRASGFTRIALPGGARVDQAVAGCCAALERVAGTGLLWAHGAAGGVLLAADGRMAELAGSDGRFVLLGGDLFDLMGAQIRRTRLGDLSSETWPRPARTERLIGVDPLAGRLILAGLDGAAVHVVTWTPEHGQLAELRLPLSRVLSNAGADTP